MASVNDRAALREARPFSFVSLFFFCLILLVTAMLCELWSHYRLFWVDELLEYYTDIKPTVGQVISGQQHAPFSLEPPGFHLVLHAMHRVLPRAKVAARLPSLVALLVTEACSFLITFRLTRSQTASFVAMLLPFYLVTLDYGVEARAYSALTASMAIGILCWIYLATEGRRRLLVACGLGLALAAAVLMHFYAVFFLVPFYLAEVTTVFTRRRVDWTTVGALVFGSLAVLADLPFKRALAPFRQHYYNTGETKWFNVLFSYHWFSRHFRIYGDADADVVQGGIVAGCFVAMLVGAAIWWTLHRRHRSEAFPPGVAVLLCSTALLPVVNLAAAQFTRAYVPRYSLPAVVGIAVLTAMVAKEFLVLPRGMIALACFLGYGGINYALTLSQEAHVARDIEFRQLKLSPEQQAVLATLPDKHIYFQDVARFLVSHYYVPQPLNVSLADVYSVSCELRWAGRDPGSLFARNFRATTAVPFLPFAELEQRPGPHLLVIFHDPKEEWIESELKAQHAEMKALGGAFGGELFEVTLAPHSTCDTDPDLHQP